MNFKASVCFLLTAVLAKTAFGAFPSVEEAGFRHCALIYLNQDKATDFFKPMLVKYENGNATEQKGFDAFLFLAYSFQSGGHAEYEKSWKSDWEFIVDGYFGNHGYVPALAEATRELKIEEKPKVIFSISWLNRDVTDFGDIDGDGHSENLSTYHGRQTVTNWFINKVVEEMKKYPELELWGFYVMREGLGDESQKPAREMCDLIHEAGYKTLWIPYYRAPGFELAKATGFDLVIMQSNWTFSTYQNEGSSRRNRLVNSAELSEKLGYGVGLELYSTEPTDQQRQIFFESLETAGEMGYQFAPCAYYFGDNFKLHTSEKEEDRKLYAAWMDFIAGKKVTAPDIGSYTESKLENGDTVIDYSLNKKSSPYVIDIFLQETEDKYFRGISSIEYSDGQKWIPGAWQYRQAFNKLNGNHQNITFFMPPNETEKIRIILSPDNGAPPPNVESVAVETATEMQTKISSSYLKSYRIYPQEFESNAPDETGRKLLDGVKGGPWSAFVGWNGGRKPIKIMFDLGYPQSLNDIRCYIELNESAAIRPPNSIIAILSNDKPVTEISGIGSVPGLNMAISSDFTLNAASKQLRCRFPGNTKARYLTLLIEPNSWFFLSEIELFGKTKIKNNSLKYTYSTHPSPPFNYQLPAYADDSAMITDGKTSNNFHSGSFGFRSTRRVVIDLGDSEKMIGRVDIYSLSGGDANIAAPAKVAISTSTDGETWNLAAELIPSPDTGRNCVEQLRLTAEFEPRTARFLQTEIVPLEGWWAFVSEITVE